MSIIVALFIGLTVSAEEIFRDRKILEREKFLNLSRLSYLFQDQFPVCIVGNPDIVICAGSQCDTGGQGNVVPALADIVLHGMLWKFAGFEYIGRYAHSGKHLHPYPFAPCSGAPPGESNDPF